MKRSALFLLLILISPVTAEDEVVSLVAQAQPYPLERDPMKTTIHQLKNGLAVYLSPNEQEPRITAWIAVRAGGAQDPADSTGMAHYLEHMLFKGSRRLGTLDFAAEKPHLDEAQRLYEELFKTSDPAKRKEIYKKIDEANQKASAYAVPNEMDKAYKSLGVRGVNAFTANERTVYVCDLPKNRLRAWARLEADRFAQPVFRLFQNEIETVYEEKNRSMDHPERIISEALDEALFPGHPYGRAILGTVEHLKNPSLAKMYSFYAKHYRPGNMAIVLSGDFNREEALKVLEEEFSVWNGSGVEPGESAPLAKPAKEQRVEVRYESEEKVIVAFPTVREDHEDADALVVMDMLTDNSQAGLINLRLNQAQKVKQAGSYPSLLNMGGSWQLWAVPKEGQTLEQAEALLLEIVESIKAGEFDAADLAAVIRDFEISHKAKLESNEGRVTVMADAFTGYRTWERQVDRIARLRAVTKEDVLSVAKKYLAGHKVTVLRRKGKPEIPAIEKPEFTKLSIEPSRESEFLKEVTSIPTEEIMPRWLAEGRDYESLDAPFGRLISAKNPMNDLFALSFSYDRGRKHERNLCEALSLLELSGAGELSADALKKRLYGLGVKMSSWCDEDSSGVAVSGLEETLDEAFSLLRLRFEKPNIASDTLKNMVMIEIGAHKDNKINPGYVMYALSEYAQRGRKSAVLGEITDGELKNLVQSDLVGLLGGFFGHKGRVSFVGARPAKDLASLLAVEGKIYPEAPAHEILVYEKASSSTVIFTHRDMVQSQVGIFSSDGVYDEERQPDYKYYSTYMGGGMSAVIFQEVREARSLAYSAGGGYYGGAEKGDENALMASLGCQFDKTIEATKLLHKLLQDMPSSVERFAESKKSIEQGYRTNTVGFRNVPGTIFAWQRLGLSGDPRPQRMERALAYELKDLESFAKRFKDKAMTIYVLGNKDRVDLEGLKSLGAFIEKPVSEIFPY